MGLLKPLCLGTRIAVFRYIKLMDEDEPGKFLTSQIPEYFSYCCCNCGYWQTVKAPENCSFPRDDFSMECNKPFQYSSTFHSVTSSLQQNELWVENMAEKSAHFDSIADFKGITSKAIVDTMSQNRLSSLPLSAGAHTQTLSEESKMVDTQNECISSHVCLSSSRKTDIACKEQTVIQSALSEGHEQSNIVSKLVNAQAELLQRRPLKSSSFPDQNKGHVFLTSTSCDVKSSPTELNTIKPPLFKRFMVGRVDDDRQPLVAKLRPFSTGYVNEEASSTAFKRSDSRSSEKMSGLLEVNRFIHKPTGCQNLSSQKKGSLHESDRCDSSSSVLPPPLPQRCDSLLGKSEEGELQFAPWFQAGIPREIALEILAREPIGSFLVRESTSKPGCFALSLRVPKHFQPSGIAHYLIMHTNKGYRIKGFTKDFGTLPSLIIHHSVMPELLPCPLLLSRYLPTFSRYKPSKDFADIECNDELKVQEK